LSRAALRAKVPEQTPGAGAFLVLPEQVLNTIARPGFRSIAAAQQSRKPASVSGSGLVWAGAAAMAVVLACALSAMIARPWPGTAGDQGLIWS